MIVNVYTDGACFRNGKPDALASWGYYVPNIAEDKGLVSDVNNVTHTNNRGELTAILKALEWAEKSKVKECRIVTDSKYAMNTILGIWKRNTNFDLLKRLDELTEKIRTEIIWVKAHNGNENNEIADSLASSVLKDKLGSKYLQPKVSIKPGHSSKYKSKKW